MKIKKIIVITVSIVIPIIITVLVALYSYGSVGNWTANQRDFVDKVYEEQTTSRGKVDTYIKFNSDLYNINTNNIELYSNYLENNSTIKSNDEGVFELDHFKMLSTVEIGNKAYNKYSHNFYFFDIDNSEIDFEKIAFIVIQTTDVDDLSLLRAEIKKYQDSFKEDTISDEYLANLTALNKNNFFKDGAAIEDITGTAKVVDGKTLNRFLYSYAPYNSYNSKNSIINLGFCHFALLNLEYDKDQNPVDATVITTGKITNVLKDKETYLSEHENILEGYGLDTLDGLKKAGYNAFIWPTILWQTCLSIVITGLLGFMFYKSWIVDQKEKEQNKNKKK